MIIKKIFIKILLFFILGFVAVFSFLIFKKIFLEQSNTFLENSSAAFLGAFFAFLFIRVADGFNKIYERHVRHYNALVTLELILNKYFITIDTSLMTLDDFDDNLKGTIETGKIHFNPRLLKTFPIHDEILLNLLGRHIINKLLSYNLDLYSLNGDLETTNRYYDDIKKNCLEKNDVDTYTHNLKNITERSDTLRKFFKSLRDKTIDLLSEIRVLMQEKPVLTRIMFKVLPTKTPRKYDEKVKKEKKKLLQEIEQIHKESKKEKEKIFF